jgi:hypothetical protein
LIKPDQIVIAAASMQPLLIKRLEEMQNFQSGDLISQQELTSWQIKT